MNQTTKNPLAGFIAAFETILLFLMGVLGNKISENLTIRLNTLIVLTGSGLGILALISYFVANPLHIQASTASPLKRLLPKTMVGIFPFGVFFGVVFGAFVSPYNLDSSLDILGWLASIFGYSSFALSTSELAGILGGCIACILFALIVDGYLAGSLLIGYWIAFSTVTVMKQPSNTFGAFITYAGQGIVFLVVAILLISLENRFQQIRKLISEPRL